MGATVDVPVVLQRTGVLEDLATLIAAVPSHGVGGAGEGFAHTV